MPSVVPLRILALGCVIATFGACARDLEDWRTTPPGDARLKLAQDFVARKVLVDLTLDQLKAVLGEPDSSQADYVYYVAKRSGEDKWDFSSIYLLACRMNEQRRVSLCVVQAD